MTIEKIKEVLNEMRTIYPFDDKETYIQLGDLVTGRISDLLEITTKDKKTGITMNYHDRWYRKWFQQYLAV